MNFEHDEIELTRRFKTEFTAAYPDVPVDWPGQNTIPANGMMARFRVSRLSDSRLIATAGTTKHYRNYGSVLVQVVGPLGEGPGKILRMIDAISLYFASWRSGGILCRTPSAGPLVEDKIAQSVTVSIPYTSDFRVEGT